MKKITFFILCLVGFVSFGQVNISENFDAGTPTGWTDTYSNVSEVACSGSSERVNIYASNASGNLTTPNLVGASNATDLNITFDYKVIEYFSDFGGTPDTPTPAGWGSAELQYSTDDGATWMTVLTIDDSNHVTAGSCAPIPSAAVIPAASLPNGSDVKLQIVNTWATGDYYFYVDNFVAQQDLGCTAAEIGTVTAINDCGNGQFTLDVVITTANDATQLNDGTNTYAITGDATTVSAGPYPSGTAVTLTVEHTLAACNFDLAEEQYFCPPANDDAASATVLTLDEGTACGANTITGITNIGSTDSGEAEPACGAYAATTGTVGDLWYTFVAPANGQATINTTNVVGISSVAGSYYSGTVGSLVEEGCRDFNIGWPWDITGLTPGNTYYLRLWDFGNNDEGSFDLCGYFVSCTSAEANAEITDCTGGQYNVTITFSNVGDATQVNDGTNTFAVSGATVVAGPYAFDTDITLTIEHSNTDCDFDLGTYNVGGCPPANDACSSAVVLSDGDSITGSTEFATNVENIDACNGGGGSTTTGCPGGTGTMNFGTGVWFVYTANVGEVITVTTDNSPTPFDTEIQVFSGDCNNLVCVGGDDDGGDNAALSTFCWESEATPDDRATVDYFIYVDGHSTNRGEFTLDINVEDTLSSDDIDNQAAFTYYPNPVKNTLTLNAQNTIDNVTMFNMLGQVVLKATPNAVDSDLDMSSLQTGTYFVQVTIANITKTVRVIKQ